MPIILYLYDMNHAILPETHDGPSRYSEDAIEIRDVLISSESFDILSLSVFFSSRSSVYSSDSPCSRVVTRRSRTSARNVIYSYTLTRLPTYSWEEKGSRRKHAGVSNGVIRDHNGQRSKIKAYSYRYRRTASQTWHEGAVIMSKSGPIMRYRAEHRHFLSPRRRSAPRRARQTSMTRSTARATPWQVFSISSCSLRGTPRRTGFLKGMVSIMM